MRRLRSIVVEAFKHFPRQQFIVRLFKQEDHSSVVVSLWLVLGHYGAGGRFAEFCQVIFGLDQSYYTYRSHYQRPNTLRSTIHANIVFNYILI